MALVDDISEAGCCSHAHALWRDGGQDLEASSSEAADPIVSRSAGPRRRSGCFRAKLKVFFVLFLFVLNPSTRV